MLVDMSHIEQHLVRYQPKYFKKYIKLNVSNTLKHYFSLKDKSSVILDICRCQQISCKPTMC